MRHANIADVKAHLSEYLREVKEGETLVICERNVPIAEVTPCGERRVRILKDRPFGLFKDEMQWTKDCFAPMTDAEVDEWEDNLSDPLRTAS